MSGAILPAKHTGTLSSVFHSGNQRARCRGTKGCAAREPKGAAERMSAAHPEKADFLTECEFFKSAFFGFVENSHIILLVPKNKEKYNPNQQDKQGGARMIRKWGKSISILGAAYTPFGDILSTPSIKGLTYRELGAWAILDALQDAGLEPGAVDSLLVSHFTDGFTKNTSHVLAEFTGMQEASISDIDTACVSPINGIRLAAGLLASGMNDVVVICAVETPRSSLTITPEGKKLAPFRRTATPIRALRGGLGGPFDQAYYAPIALSPDPWTGAIQGLRYAKEYGLRIAELEDALDAAYINSRRASALNPCAWLRQPLEEEAAEHGFSRVRDYLRSENNPVYDWPYREFSRHLPCDGAAAIVLCRTEDAGRYAGKPVTVAGLGAASGGGNFGKPENPEGHIDRLGEEIAIRQAYAMAGITPAEIGYVGIHDCMLQSHFQAAEALGYLPRGEGWRWVLEGRTAYDGDRPLNTHGGDCAFGNAFDATAMADIVESVRQIRGEAGAAQIGVPPEVAVNHSFGGGCSGGVVVLRKDGTA